MATIAEIKESLDAIEAADVAEDAAFQASIDVLSAKTAAMTIELDTLKAERTGIIAELIAARDSLSARITALGG